MLVQGFRAAAVEIVPEPATSHGRVAVLVNAHARKVTPKVIRALSHVVPEGDFFQSRSLLDARRIAAHVVEQGYRTVLLGGGDGTVTCFINEIAHQVSLKKHHMAARMPRFGILKLGTGNSVASWMNASSPRGDGFVDDVLRTRSGAVSSSRTVDLLQIEGRRAPFCGLGVDGRLLNDYVWFKETLAHGPLSRVMTGASGYFASVALKTVPYYLTHSTAVQCRVVNGRHRGLRVTPTTQEAVEPGATLFCGPLMMVAAGTVPFYGFELKMFPFAGKQRGFMHLRLGRIPPTSVLANLPGLWNGSWFPEGISDFLVREARIQFDAPMPLQIAGDAAGERQEVHLEMSSDSIDLLDFGGGMRH